MLSTFSSPNFPYMHRLYVLCVHERESGTDFRLLLFFCTCNVLLAPLKAKYICLLTNKVADSYNLCNCFTQREIYVKESTTNSGGILRTTSLYFPFHFHPTTITINTTFIFLVSSFLFSSHTPQTINGASVIWPA